MKKITTMVLCLSMISMTTACISANDSVSAKVSNTNLVVNNQNVAVSSYLIDDYNYIKLRDIATMINNTEKNFEVLWNDSTKSIELNSNKTYQSVGEEMVLDSKTSATATKATSAIYIDGEKSDLSAYKIEDNNYFKLRDIMEIFDVYVGWDQETQTATLDTTKSYTAGESALNSSDYFSNRDYKTELNDENPTYITLNDSSEIVTIDTEGTYVFSGSVSNGQIVVDMIDQTHKAQIVLDNVNMTNTSEACINVVLADKVFITTTENSKNYINSTISDETSIDGGIFARSDVTLNGLGSLEINVKNGDGIVGKDEVTITSGDYKITADGHGIDSNDGVAIADGTFEINAGKDGIHSEHSTNVDKGYVYILDGKFDITCDGDGIDASSFLEISGGDFDVETNGGYANAPVKTATENNHGGGMMGGQNQTQGGMQRPGMGEAGMEQGDILNEQNLGMQRPGMGDAGMEQGDILNEQNLGMQRPGMGEAGMEQGDILNEQNLGMQRPGMGEAGMEQGQIPNEQNTQTPDTQTDSTTSTKGFKAVSEIRIYNGKFNLDCYDDAIHSDTNVKIYGGDFTVGTADDAFHANHEMLIAGGKIKIINSFEGIEGQRITISGGHIDMICGDDGINASTTNPDPNNSEISITITGGTIIMDTNAEGDGVDSNGSILITGGEMIISSTTDQRDTTLDSNGDSIITGGRFIGTGSSSMTIQNFDKDSTQGSILVTLNAVQLGNVTLVDSKGEIIVDFDPVKEYQAIIISVPEIVSGETYTLKAGEYVQEILMDGLQYSTTSQNGMGGNTGGRPR